MLGGNLKGKNSIHVLIQQRTMTATRRGLKHSWAGKLSSACLHGAACKKGRASMGTDAIFAAGCGGG
jgi:hypothetical protein